MVALVNDYRPRFVDHKTSPEAMKILADRRIQPIRHLECRRSDRLCRAILSKQPSEISGSGEDEYHFSVFAYTLVGGTVTAKVPPTLDEIFEAAKTVGLDTAKLKIFFMEVFVHGIGFCDDHPDVEAT